MLPDEMKDSSAPVWKNETLFQQKIKEILPVGAKTTISRRVPQCLILDAPTLLELLIVLNWWLSLSPSRKGQEFKLLRNTYMRPTKSNERMPPPSKIVLAMDRQEVLPIRSLVARAQKACQALMDETVKLPLGVNFECSLILKRNVATPRKVSKTPEDELILEHDKMIVMARNESALGYIFGEDTARRLIDDDGAVMWFHGDHPNETYSQNLAKKRAQEKVKDSQETSRDTAHTSATIDTDDFLNYW
jgi:hypothetical protein